MAQPSMDIHQISVTYQPEQDRLLLRISTRSAQEFRLWLTRRLLLGLWPMLNQSLAQLAVLPVAVQPGADGHGPLAPHHVPREALLEDNDFATPYSDEGLALPLGAEPLLVTEVALTPRATGLNLAFSEQLAARSGGLRGFSAELDPRLAQGLALLLAQALEQADWRLHAAAQPAAQGEDVPDRPRWLN